MGLLFYGVCKVWGIYSEILVNHGNWVSKFSFLGGRLNRVCVKLGNRATYSLLGIRSNVEVPVGVIFDFFEY